MPFCNAIASTSKIQDAFAYVTCLIGKSIIPIIVTFGVVMLVWGIVNFFILGADEEAKRSQGKQFIIWGVVALAVIVSVWGIVRIFGNTFRLDTSVLPGVRPPGNSSGPGPGGDDDGSGDTGNCRYVGQVYTCDPDYLP